MDNLKDNSINILYKPKGITSFDLIRIIKHNTDIKKIGHAGTLDPNAEGLMILGTGTATKKLTHLVGRDKSYVAEIRLGIKTDSGDTDGNIIAEEEVSEMNTQNIQKALKSLLGKNILPVSLFSAIKKNGKPLYKYARRGEHIEQPKREMTVYTAKLLTYEHPFITVEFKVSSGTYIRSLSEELANRLDTIGALSNLKRIAIDEYTIEEAVHIPINIIENFIQRKQERLQNKNAR